VKSNILVLWDGLYLTAQDQQRYPDEEYGGYMYPYDFTPTLRGLNPEEVFVVMPFATKYDPVFTDLIQPAVELVADNLGRALGPYRTKGDPRTTSGWIEVLEHLYTAQVVLGVLTREVNANVHYELGIAHATQPIRRQVLIAEGQYRPKFDTKDLIFMRYKHRSPSDSVQELTQRIKTALSEWEVEKEKLVQHAIAKISPFEFEIVMIWAGQAAFAVATSGTGPDDYEQTISQFHGTDKRFMHGVFERHCEAIARLQHGGLLGLLTHANPPRVEFSYYWTDLGNLVLRQFGLIDDKERIRRYEEMPRHLRRVT
jgi:hypothetical protein